MYKLVLTLISILLAAAVFAQDSTRLFSFSTDGTIKVSVISRGRSFHTVYTINGIPITESILERHLMSYPPAAQELQQYKTICKHQSTGGLICAAVGFGALIAAHIQANQSKVSSGPNFNNAPVFFSISIAGLTGGMAFLFSRNRHLDKAIDAYNRLF